MKPETLAEEIMGAFDAQYGRRVPGSGFANLIQDYEWPRGTNYEAMMRQVTPMLNRATALAASLKNNGDWTPSEYSEGAKLAEDIMRWGGVWHTRQHKPLGIDVFQTFHNALHPNVLYPKSRMDSGYTKIAAFATYHLEDGVEGLPHAIWDSRVAAAITRAIETVWGPEYTALKEHLPDICLVVGRGGSRKDAKPTGLWRRHFTWRRQWNGSLLINQIKDALNRHQRTEHWTVWKVDAALFVAGR